MTHEQTQRDIAGEEVVYLYALIRSGVRCEVEVPGVTDAPSVSVRELGTAASGEDERSFAAVLDAVDADQWTGETGRANLETLEWVGPRAVSHEEVVRDAFESTAVYPVRFGTLFSSLDSLCEHVDQRTETIDAFLDRIEGCEEWGVKGFLDRDAATDSLVDIESEEETEGAQSGTAYLEERARERERDERADEKIDSWLSARQRELSDALADHADASKTLEIRPGAGGDRDDELIVNWTFLLAPDSVEDFCASVDAANERVVDRGLQFEVSGPWPPFSFRPDPAD